MMESENAPFCPRFPEKRAVHIRAKKEIGMTVWYKSEGLLVLILRLGVIEWEQCRNLGDSFFFRRDTWRIWEKANLITKIRFLSLSFYLWFQSRMAIPAF